MKNKGIIITAIVLLVAIVICSIVFLVKFLKGDYNLRNAFISLDGNKSTNIIFDKKFELGNIKDIEIKHDAGEVIFKETTDESIQIVLYGENENDIKVDYTNEKISVEYKRKVNFNFFNFGTAKNDVIIYIPTSYYNNIKVENDYGNCKIIDLPNATINVNCDAGNVELGKVKNATIKCDYGNVEVKEISNKCNIKADCGNIKIDKVLLKENSSISADLGNVDINDTNDIFIDANVDLGKTYINRNNKNAEITLKIDCDCGNISVNN